MNWRRQTFVAAVLLPALCWLVGRPSVPRRLSPASLGRPQGASPSPAISVAAQTPASTQGPGPAIAEEFQRAPRVEPQNLAKLMRGPVVHPPLVLQVGVGKLYRAAHIAGAVYAGPASEPSGLAALRRVASSIPRDRQIVIYCGCCPMDKCPNIRPAYHALRQMGFLRLEVLDIPQDFVHDWVAMKFPVAPPQPR